MPRIPPNKFHLGNLVTIYRYTEIHNKITAMEFRKTDQTWCYQVGHSSWWAESSLDLIK